jgi:hypothetical protein
MTTFCSDTFYPPHLSHQKIRQGGSPKAIVARRKGKRKAEV